MDRFKAMRVLVAVLDTGSLSGAATTLRMSLPTVSRILAGLERELGVRLIARTTRGIAETDGGRLYYRRPAVASVSPAAIPMPAQPPMPEYTPTYCFPPYS
jgi:hypothetical protein